MGMAVDQGMDLVFKGLADPTRRSLLDELFARDGQTLTELEERLPMTRFGVSKHLKVLEGAGLISRGRDAQYRPCRLEAEALDEAVDWIAEHRQIWADRFDRLGAHIDAIQRADHHRQHRQPDEEQPT